MSNVISAKLFFGVVLDRLQASFPAAVHLRPADLWPEFEKLAHDQTISLKDARRSFQTLPVEEVARNEQLQIQYMKLMLRWMTKEGFIHSDPASDFPYDYVLSSKSLAILGLTMADKRTTLGDKLSQATGRLGDTVQSETVARLIGKAFEMLQGVSA